MSHFGDRKLLSAIVNVSLSSTCLFAESTGEIAGQSPKLDILLD